ncbi:MAG: NAD(P)H-hydrate dehydratase [Motiliproteus sp.]|nr:NAD(P)H-hydrate dehydratase [Motiliproteus sp.]MCW9053193.1 NAD(P)H-hydrate dehydratase [Motiliproteus sp.]
MMSSNMVYPQAPDRARLYTAAQTRKLDRLAIEQQGIPGFELMKRAAKACYRALLQHWPEAESVTVLCGPGNNGGDGLVIAGLLLESHSDQPCPEVKVYMVGGDAAVERLQGEALEASHWARSRGVAIEPYSVGLQIQSDVVVDALLGTGLQGDVRGDYVDAINAINGCSAPVLAVDLPSGLCSDRGAVLGIAVSAEVTVSFIGLKRGLMTHQGPEHCGELLFSDLGVPDAVYEQVESCEWVIDQNYLSQQLAPRDRGAHKGSFGHLLIIGGNQGMAGAALMAAEAAMRTGAGLVTLATQPWHVSGCNVRCPEVMAHGVRSRQELQPLLDKATTLLIGPGLGDNPWSDQMMLALQECRLPAVLDADALNLLSGSNSPLKNPADSVITPHPGEAGRILGCANAEVQADRFAAVKKLQQWSAGTVVLKGAGTLVADGHELAVCRQGNPGMASGGMGDVLAGIIASLLAQGFSAADAARIGVRVHAEAADRAASVTGERGLIATELFNHLGALLNPAQNL